VVRLRRRIQSAIPTRTSSTAPVRETVAALAAASSIRTGSTSQFLAPTPRNQMMDTMPRAVRVAIWLRWRRLP
jgi:hypothetical protein